MTLAISTLLLLVGTLTFVEYGLRGRHERRKIQRYVVRCFAYTLCALLACLAVRVLTSHEFDWREILLAVLLSIGGAIAPHVETWLGSVLSKRPDQRDEP